MGYFSAIMLTTKIGVNKTEADKANPKLQQHNRAISRIAPCINDSMTANDRATAGCPYKETTPSRPS